MTRGVKWGGRQQITYKHAISTIAPVRPVDLTEEGSAIEPAPPESKGRKQEP